MRGLYQKNLPQFQILEQENVPVEISQFYQNYSQLAFRQRRLPQFQLLIQVPLPVDIPCVFLLKFQRRGVPKFQLLVTGTLQVHCPQTYHICFHHTCHLRSLIMSPQYIYYRHHSHPWYPQFIHLITPPYHFSNPKFASIYSL